MTLHAGDENDVVRDAAAKGLQLTQRPLDNGERAWVWVVEHDDRPQPWFLMRRQAIEYMSEKLENPKRGA